jgi:heme exporter protein D
MALHPRYGLHGWEYATLVVLAVASLGAVVADVVLAGALRQQQRQAEERAAYIGESVALGRAGQSLMQAIADLHSPGSDRELRSLLQSYGISVPSGPAESAAETAAR